jgi:hypothetical protein
VDGSAAPRSPSDASAARFVKMYEIEDDAVARDLSDPATRAVVRRRILDTIEAYRPR